MKDEGFIQLYRDGRSWGRYDPRSRVLQMTDRGRKVTFNLNEIERQCLPNLEKKGRMEP